MLLVGITKFFGAIKLSDLNSSEYIYRWLLWGQLWPSNFWALKGWKMRVSGCIAIGSTISGWSEGLQTLAELFLENFSATRNWWNLVTILILWNHLLWIIILSKHPARDFPLQIRICVLGIFICANLLINMLSLNTKTKTYKVFIFNVCLLL